MQEEHKGFFYLFASNQSCLLIKYDIIIHITVSAKSQIQDDYMVFRLHLIINVDDEVAQVVAFTRLN